MKNQKWVMIREYWMVWTFALILYNLIRNVGTIELDGIQTSVGQGLLLSPAFGLIFALMFSLGQVTFERFYDKRTPLIKLLLVRIGLSMVLLFVITSLAHIVFIKILGRGDLTYGQFITNPPIFTFYAYIVVVDSLTAIFRLVSLMLGKGTLKKLITGEFYHPREEERIFLFLDLKSSTEMAEKLGHFKYSCMIQDCFDDLAVVTETEVEIYQYVGDEAILTWPAPLGLKDQNCIHAFYTFKARLKERESHYLTTYGYQPIFKAGLNLGKVTVAEVGKIKKEIAYHGDTINTAARIQGQCNAFNSELLISEHLKNTLGDLTPFKVELMGNIPLRGKSDKVGIYSLRLGTS